MVDCKEVEKYFTNRYVSRNYFVYRILPKEN